MDGAAKIDPMQQ